MPHAEDLRMRHGRPSDRGFSILSLGKLGGNELNYSSDIDLLFVYDASGETAGPKRITNKEFYQKLSNQLTDLLSTYTAAGLSYRVDLRLRPDGRLGEVCISLDGARNYYASARGIGNCRCSSRPVCRRARPEPGAELLRFVEPLIYSTTLDFSVVESPPLRANVSARSSPPGAVCREGSTSSWPPAASATSSSWCSASSACMAGGKRGCGTEGPCWRSPPSR